ncbi:hypothetical protein N7508_009728 [Penicillium antarcticum]|uniref:uncharacterized protein n=1 Tax=Penicillium antarcticum TaxID=416450 RepID=UPI00238F07CC|nr:uncharacterized protein N7508_009728 [Penicillium antarcticum]KAJ5294907.1 hypothetical protein N7508_009728 [Penicillium antarcticum]
MKRFLGSLSRRSSEFLVSTLPATSLINLGSSDSVDHRDDSPEAIIAKELTAFCESNSSSRDANQQGNEFVHLPQIVETAESSPNAAKEAAYRIRKYLADPAGTPNNVQYNALMLTRILVDNPGHTFTRNFDAKFVSTIKELLRAGRDWHVQSYLRQYLDTLEQQRSWDEDLKLLLQMWTKEKSKPQRGLIDRFPMASGVAPPVPPHPNPHRNAYAGARAQDAARPPSNALPNAEELAARIEEAKNSAKLLSQFVQSTPAAELEDNDLVKEFVDRCRTGSRLIQGYIHSTNPAPDEDTLLTLIETNDEISVALSQQQRAMLKARKARGSSSPGSSNVNSPEPTSQPLPFASGAAAPREQPLPPVPVAAELPSTAMTGGRMSSATATPTATAAPGNAGRYEYRSEDFQVQNPFADDYAEDSDGRNQHQSQRDRVHFQPAEQER